MNVAPTTDATALFRAAYDNRYTWDSSFPGYTADVTYRCAGTEFHGKAVVSPDPRMGYKGEVAGETGIPGVAIVVGGPKKCGRVSGGGNIHEYLRSVGFL